MENDNNLKSKIKTNNYQNFSNPIKFCNGVYCPTCFQQNTFLRSLQCNLPPITNSSYPNHCCLINDLQELEQQQQQLILPSSQPQQPINNYVPIAYPPIPKLPNSENNMNFSEFSEPKDNIGGSSKYFNNYKSEVQDCDGNFKRNYEPNQSDDQQLKPDSRIVIKKRSNHKLEDPINLYGKAMTGNIESNFNPQSHYYKTMNQIHDRFESQTNLFENSKYQKNTLTENIQIQTNDEEFIEAKEYNDNYNSYLIQQQQQEQHEQQNLQDDYCENKTIDPRTMVSLNTEKLDSQYKENQNQQLYTNCNCYNTSEYQCPYKNRDIGSNPGILTDKSNKNFFDLKNSENNENYLKKTPFVSSPDDCCLEYLTYQKLKNSRKQKRDQLVENQKNEIRNQLMKQIYSPRSKNCIKINHENIGNGSIVTQINSVNFNQRSSPTPSILEFRKKLNPNAPSFISQQSQQSNNSNNINNDNRYFLSDNEIINEEQSNSTNNYSSEYLIDSSLMQNNNDNRLYDRYLNSDQQTNNGMQQGDHKTNFLQPNFEFYPLFGKSNMYNDIQTPEQIMQVNYFDVLSPTAKLKSKENLEKMEAALLRNEGNSYFGEMSPNLIEKKINPITGSTAPSNTITATITTTTTTTTTTTSTTSKSHFQDKQSLINDSIIQDLKKFINLLQSKNPNLTIKDIQDILENIPKIPIDDEKSTIDFLSKKIYEIDSALESKNQNEKDIQLENISYVCRARYIPTKIDSDEPLPQYEIIQSSSKAQINRKSTHEVKLATNINLDRQPLTCPITHCNQKKIFISEFSKHIKVDHLRILIETITPGQCRNLFFDPKITHEGINKCIGLYLVTNKVKNLGNHEFKDYLPIVVMTSKIRIRKLFNNNLSNTNLSTDEKYFVIIWLTGLITIDLPIFYTFVVWSNGDKIPINHFVQSGELYSIRENQNPEIIFKTGKCIILTPDQCDRLTNNGKNMINIQISIQ